MTIVFEFKPKPPEPDVNYPSTVKSPDYTKPTCTHNRSEIDIKARRLTCRDCGVALDPIDVIAQWAQRWDRERLRVRDEHQLDRAIIEWHKAGGRIVLRPSGVVVEFGGEKWAASCSGGPLAQLRSALQRGRWAIDAKKRHAGLPKTEGVP